MEACAEACRTGLPTHGGRDPRECHSFQWSPSVTAGNLGQCWRFVEATPTETGNRGPDFVFCSDESPATPEPSATPTRTPSASPTPEPTDISAPSCPAGWYEKEGQNFDAEHTTYTIDMEACAEACRTGLPTHGGRDPRECHSFQWSPSVTAGNLGQCWRFVEATPTETGNRGPDFVFCSDESSATPEPSATPTRTPSASPTPEPTDISAPSCPVGWYEMEGQNFDAEHTTYTIDMKACAEAYRTGLPTHGGRDP